MSMYNEFQMDTSLEKNGIVLDYGAFRVTVARAGGANRKFAKVLEQKTKPYRRAIQTETMNSDRADELLKEAYAEAVILNWETRDESGEWSVGIEDQNGKILPFCDANLIITFKNLPELFKDIQEQANKISLFRIQVNEDDVKNS